MKEEYSPHEKFGRLVTETISHSAIINYYMILDRKKYLERLIGDAALNFDDQTLVGVRLLLDDCIKASISSLMFAFDSCKEDFPDLRISAEGVDLLDGTLQPRLYGEGGWIEKYGDTSGIDKNNYGEIS